jgi:hypothetical protein
MNVTVMFSGGAGIEPEVGKGEKIMVIGFGVDVGKGLKKSRREKRLRNLFCMFSTSSHTRDWAVFRLKTEFLREN